MDILDFLFPKYCVNCKKFGDYLCADCFSRLSFDTKNICLICGSPSYNGLTHPRCYKKYSVEGSFTGLVFNSVSKKLVYQFKYKPNLTDLRKFIGDLLYESLIQNEEFGKVINKTNNLVFVPIPLSSKKLRTRGYNQAEILAKELARKFNLEVINCLERIRDTRSQVGLNKKERRENIKGAFEIKIKDQKSKLKNKNVILVDDVLTSGATISEACRVLKMEGAKKVWAAAFAKED